MDEKSFQKIVHALVWTVLKYHASFREKPEHASEYVSPVWNLSEEQKGIYFVQCSTADE